MDFIIHMGTLSKKQFKLIVGIKNRAREVFDEMCLIKPANISIQDATMHILFAYFLSKWNCV